MTKPDRITQQEHLIVAMLEATLGKNAKTLAIYSEVMKLSKIAADYGMECASAGLKHQLEGAAALLERGDSVAH